MIIRDLWRIVRDCVIRKKEATAKMCSNTYTHTHTPSMSDRKTWCTKWSGKKPQKANSTHHARCVCMRTFHTPMLATSRGNKTKDFNCDGMWTSKSPQERSLTDPHNCDRRKKNHFEPEPINSNLLLFVLFHSQWKRNGKKSRQIFQFR